MYGPAYLTELYLIFSLIDVWKKITTDVSLHRGGDVILLPAPFGTTGSPPALDTVSAHKKWWQSGRHSMLTIAYPAKIVAYIVILRENKTTQKKTQEGRRLHHLTLSARR